MERRAQVYVLRLWRDEEGVRIEVRDAAEGVRYFPNLERLVEHLRSRSAAESDPEAADRS